MDNKQMHSEIVGKIKVFLVSAIRIYYHLSNFNVYILALLV